MGAYTPLDLNALYNVGLDVLGGQGPLGAQSFRGLPFALGSDAGRCLIACGGERSGVEIPVGRRATWMIVAHRLLESRIADNGPLAVAVAEYALHYEDGEVLKVPVRDRFEISTVPSSYGGAPFVAVPDTNDQVLPRTEGPWDMAGRRQTEADAGRAQDFVLWAWPNPHPDKGLEKIAIEAAGSGLCHRRDHPERFGRRADLPRGHARGHRHPAARRGRARIRRYRSGS